MSNPATHEPTAGAHAPGADARTYAVAGMSCAHCVAAVSRELEGVAGVRAVDVDLAGGRVTVSGPADDAAVRAAIADAGYEVAA